ncbi:MAG TPA: immune inhibitor A domain-containing protein [Bacilli bacterium]|nr:immune inhibitor A domain-containing protein [Bacilli bacterium]
MNKKLLTVGLSTALFAGSLLAAGPTNATVAAAGGGAPIDLGIVNHDRMIDALVKQGVIDASLSPEEKTAAMNQYLQKRAQSSEFISEKSSFKAEAAKVKASAKGATSSKTVAPATAQQWDGGTKTDKILVIMAEYSDFEHNSIDQSETDMYYHDYAHQHYQDMLFNKNGYTGPNGEHLMSMAQYYLQQSGGSYTVSGDVVGWVKVPHTAAYYGGNVGGDGNDQRPQQFIRDALDAAAASGADLSQYDQQDIYDLDGDGNLNEPDGLIDHLMVIHSGVGEEAGGGHIGGDAIWSHSWDLGYVYPVAGTSTDIPYWGGSLGAFHYTVEPEDGAAGVFAHEFGHDLGLPDEYDTIYSGGGEPVGYWSIMSSGSWAGLIPGTEPTSFSPYDKEYFQNRYGGNWQHLTEIDFSDLTQEGLDVKLDQASQKGEDSDAVRINLPDQINHINTPAGGSYEYWGGKGDGVDRSAVASLDLTGATNATLDYDTWYDIESTWDYGFVQVSEDNGATWTSLSTANTSSELNVQADPTIAANVPGYTGNSNGWVHETIDLSQYAGKQIQLQFRYMTDAGANLDGFFVDNVAVTADGATVLSDDAEGASALDLYGFTQSKGEFSVPHYYLVEWRNHQGADNGLAHIARGNSVLSYDPGMVVWYVNGAYDNNWVGVHPGYGFLGVVDAHQNVHHWGGNIAAGVTASTSYQIFDAAFSLTKGSDLDIDYGQGQHMSEAAKNPVAGFNDKNNYYTPSSVYSGLHLPSYGLKIQVTGEAADRSAATINISK